MFIAANFKAAEDMKKNICTLSDATDNVYCC